MFVLNDVLGSKAQEHGSQIIIDGDKFRATRLLPNYRGEYTCKCEECHLSLDWAKFGQYKHCLEVKCIDHNFDEGNRNVWVRDAGLDGVEDIHAGMTIDCAVCGERFEDDEGYESYYDDADGKQIEEAASLSYDWKKLGDKWYCSDCWDWVICEIDGGEAEVVRTKDGKMFWEDDEELSPEEYKKVKIKED